MKMVIGGRYEFDPSTDIIGRGGMGAVYRGKDMQTGDVVAIKQLRPDILSGDTSMFAARFKREGDILRHILQNIQHPNIINLIEVINDAEQGQFLVMEYVGGGSLWDELQSYPQLPIIRALSIAQAIASALMALHHENVIHRDIKPSNILIADDKSPRLCDFGVVHVQDMTRMTATDGVIGTLDYISPEQLNGESVTPSCDIWAFGVMLFEMLAGKRPFYGDNMSAIITAIITKPHPNLNELRPDIPPALMHLVDMMLIKNPRERINSMKLVYESLDAIANGGDISALLTNMRLPSQRIIQRIGTLPQNFADIPFYDRDHQRAEIANLITDKKPLISIYGRGGIGKTALVSKVLGDFEKTGFVDGVAYLRANSTPPLNISTLLDALGGFLPHDHDFHTTFKNANVSVTDKTHALINGLADGHYVVYVDNLETLQHDDNHTLIDDELRQFFETVLERRGGGVMTVVITSRYPIPLPNLLKAHESVVRLDEGLPEADAIHFLREMDSQKVLPATDTHLHIWINRVAGFPRGLEALVGYLNGGDTRHIEDLLDDPNLFEGEVLSNIVHHAHNSLPADFRQVLAGVAVIGQSTTRAEVEYLLTPYIESAPLRRILERLVESRFLAYHRQNRTYSLHPIDQAYAVSSTPLGKVGDDEMTFTRYVLHGRMADYYVNQRTPESEWKSLDDLQPQLREMEHRYVIGDYDAVADIFLKIDFDYLLLWGYTQLVLQWHTRLDGLVQNPSLAQRCIGNLGWLYYFMENKENYEKAMIYTQKALAMAHEQGDRKGKGMWLGNLGNVYLVLGQTDPATEYFQQALAIAREVQDRRAEGVWLGRLGFAYHQLGQPNTAIAYHQQALVIAREVQDRRRESGWLSHLGMVYGDLGQLDTAIDYFQQALVITREIKDRVQEGWWLCNIGMALIPIGRYTEAITHIQQAITIGAEIKDEFSLQYFYGFLATAHWLSDDKPNALTAIRQARTYDIPINNHVFASFHGCITFCVGELEEAQTAFYETLEIANALLDKSTQKQYEPLYARALAFGGLWVVTGDDAYYADSLKAYDEAKAVCGYAGVLLQHRQYLEALLRCTDKDGSALVALLT